MNDAPLRFQDAQGLVRLLADHPGAELARLPDAAWDGILEDAWRLAAGRLPVGRPTRSGRLRVDVDVPGGRRIRFLAEEVPAEEADGPTGRLRVVTGPAGPADPADQAGPPAGGGRPSGAALGLSGTDLLRLVAGQLSLEEAFRSGAVRLSGDVGLAREMAGRLGMPVESGAAQP